MLEVKAEAKYIRTSAQKAGLVLDLIRGKRAAEALSILRFTNKSVARDIEKALRSAIAGGDMLGKEHVLDRLPEIYTRFILAVDPPCLPGRPGKTALV